MDTPEAIERAAKIGMLAGLDLETARAQLGAGQPELRALVHARITDVVAAIDDHEAHLEDWRSPVFYRCRCEFRGTEQEWERHLADKLADALTQAGQ